MTTLERKCLEMELRQHLELQHWEADTIDLLMVHLMPFMERKILEREGR